MHSQKISIQVIELEKTNKQTDRQKIVASIPTKFGLAYQNGKTFCAGCSLHYQASW